jgi:hypothetical protein
VYATREPSGEMRGLPTPLIFKRSIAVSSFLPSLARGAADRLCLRILLSASHDGHREQDKHVVIKRLGYMVTP